ncbi:hypothetical protein VTN49DRAFT_1039 [Thermomyces lanuginosus]|uniref:uncharacterized protein n=1 Tax=Thermomyces lanuginosus TaxID=5541 RepID=UPI003741FD82
MWIDAYQLLATVPPSVNADYCQRTAIVGLGGVGKTQIALEIAFRLREKHPDCSVFWVPTIDVVSFKNAYRAIGQLLEIDEINDDKAGMEEIVKTALNHESTGRWLMIVDNAENPDLFYGSTNLAGHLPFSQQGSLIFTSRNHELIVQLGVSAPNIFDVGSMSEKEGFNLLEKHLAKHQMRSQEDTAELLDFLGYLRLPIRQASAYMARKQISTTNYLELCRSSDKNIVELLSKDFEDSHRYREAQSPITATWLISFCQIADHNPLAAEYLKFMCFLNEKAIPRSILPQDASTLEADDAIGTLKGYAFITEREVSNMYDVHRLVRLAMMNWLDKQGELEEWRAKHVLEHETTATNEMSELEFKLGRGSEILGQYRQAETLHRRALEAREKLLGCDHPSTLDSVDNLGTALKCLGQCKKAEAMHRRALEGQEKVLGRDHPDTLDTINNLGLVFQHQGQYDKAETMYQRALEG